MSEREDQGPRQYIWLTIANKNPQDGASIWITNIRLLYGILYDGQIPGEEVPPESIIGREIRAQRSFTIHARGKSNVGTEGTVTLSESRGENSDTITNIYWDSPVSSQTNTLKPLGNPNDDWIVEIPSFNSPGPIGAVRVQISRRRRAQ